MSKILPQASDVIEFWFTELKPQQWWNGGENVDAMIRERFGDLIDLALEGGLAGWVDTADGRLALVLILDQFTRNIFRGTGKAFAGDARAIEIVTTAIADGDLKHYQGPRRQFFLMPLMHSEERDVHVMARLYFDEGKGLESFDEHAEVVRRFGRYPTRNRALGRESTAEELEYLKEGGGWGQ